MKSFSQGIAGFLAVCAMGFVTAMAGGIRWGTDAASATAGMSFTLASLVFVAIATFPRDGE